jgi:hypothetical protein
MGAKLAGEPEYPAACGNDFLAEICSAERLETARLGTFARGLLFLAPAPTCLGHRLARDVV